MSLDDSDSWFRALLSELLCGPSEEAGLGALDSVLLDAMLGTLFLTYIRGICSENVEPTPSVLVQLMDPPISLAS